jgi:hypothetical protein
MKILIKPLSHFKGTYRARRCFSRAGAHFGNIKRHPGGRVITTAYYSLININDHQLDLSDNELHWHPVSEITEMAFDHRAFWIFV